MLKQPITQVRLTNVAVVKLKKNGQRFEISCFKNKVVNWRNGMQVFNCRENDLSEVIQAEEIFQNVSKGQIAKITDLRKCFKTTDKEAIIKEILSKGELQISDKEREVHQKNLLNDIATIIADKTVHKDTKKQFPVQIITRALEDLHFNPKQNISSKKQALDMIKELQNVMPIVRASMEIQVCFDPNQIQIDLNQFKTESITQISAGIYRLVIKPKDYRKIIEFADKKEGITITILDQSVSNEEEIKVTQTIEETKVEIPAVVQVEAEPKVQKWEKQYNCKNCQIGYESLNDHRAHFKSDWHKVNLKRKTREQEILSEAEFSIMDPEKIKEILQDKRV